jgi:hypothetical protein
VVTDADGAGEAAAGGGVLVAGRSATRVETRSTARIIGERAAACVGAAELPAVGCCSARVAARDVDRGTATGSAGRVTVPLSVKF